MRLYRKGVPTTITILAYEELGDSLIVQETGGLWKRYPKSSFSIGE